MTPSASDPTPTNTSSTTTSDRLYPQRGALQGAPLFFQKGLKTNYFAQISTCE